MPVCQSKYHGTISYEPAQVLHVPAGLFGFSAEQEFLLLELPSTRPLAFIQSIRTPDLCFISMPAQVVTPDYRLALSPTDIEILGYTPDQPPQMGRDLLCLALLTIRENHDATANLLAPLVIDIARHQGRQVVTEAGYSHQHAIRTAEWKRAC